MSMSLVMLFGSAFVIGLSGAMMPGPLLTYVINATLRRGFKAGPMIMVGHALLELLLIVLMFLGLKELFAREGFTSLIGIIGGGVLFWMGYGMVKAVWNRDISIEKQTGEGAVTGLVVPGAVISLSNPYWILWWATVGMTYLATSYKHGYLGAVVFYLGHISSDFAWYSLVSGIVAYGRRLINDRVYRGLVMSFGLLLLYFALSFIVEGVMYFT